MNVYKEKHISIRKNGSTFHVRVLVPNNPTPLQRKQGGFTTIGQAKSHAFEFREELLSRRKTLAKGYSNFESAKTLYLQHKLGSFAPKTQYCAEKFFSSWTSHWDSKLLSEFTTADMYNFMCKMKESVAPSTVVRNMGYLKGVFQHFMNLGEIGTNPCAAVELPKLKRQKKRDAMTRSEITAVLDYANRIKHPLYPFIFLAYQTGARSAELKELRISDFDLENRYVTIARTLQDDGSIGPTKSGMPRTIPINGSTVEFVRELAAGKRKSDRVLPEYKSFYRGDGAKQLRILQQEIGIRNTNFHSIRGSFITHLLLANVPFSVVQNLAGHVDPKTTMEYVRMVAADMKGSTDSLNLITSAIGVTMAPADDFTKALLSL